MERWVDIKGYEGLYQISDLGNVWSVPRKVIQGNHGKTRWAGLAILKPTDNGKGYKIVGLRKNGKRKNFYLHRLVAEHFCENPSGYSYVNHKDYDPSNNKADNLEWCTQKQNTRYSAERMRRPHKQWKPSATGEKYIYFRDGRFRLSIRNLIDKTFGTLEEAVSAREVVLRGEKYLAE